MMPIAAAPGLTMLVYTAAPETPTGDALQLLASWAAAELPTRTSSADLPS
jgi:hypothetical protein